MWKWLRQLFDPSIADYLRLMATRDGAAMVMDVPGAKDAVEAINDARKRYTVPPTHELSNIDATFDGASKTWVVAMSLRRRPGVYCVDTLTGKLVEL